jgi:hypothetical protein
MLNNRHLPTAGISFAELQCNFESVPHDTDTHSADERGAGGECAFDNVCAGSRGCEQVRCWDAEVGEARVWACDGGVAAEGGVGEDLVGGWGVGGDVGAGEEEDEDF